MKLAGSMLAMVCAAALTAACNTGRPLSDPHVCNALVVQDQLIYPAPGSTAIPDALNVIVVAPQVAFVELQPASGATVFAVAPTAVPSPLPSPNAPGQFSAAARVAFSVPPLAAATTYTVIAEPFSGPCGFPQTLGSFTTQ